MVNFGALVISGCAQMVPKIGVHLPFGPKLHCGVCQNFPRKIGVGLLDIRAAKNFWGLISQTQNWRLAQKVNV